VKLRYFAWVRERIGRPEEDLDPPAEVLTVADLLAWLQGRGPEYENALAEASVIRVAVDQVHVQRNAAVTGAREVALFPPMTGG
jgi:molybdopterin synthase sulfur carrier subunit